MRYTSILHTAQRELDISVIEYCVANSVSLLCTQTSPVPGWCIKSRGHMAEDFCITRRSVINIVNRLTSIGIIERSDSDNLRTTPKWEVAIKKAQDELQETERGVKKIHTPMKELHSGYEKNSQQGVKEVHAPSAYSSHNNKSNNKRVIVKEEGGETQPTKDSQPTTQDSPRTLSPSPIRPDTFNPIRLTPEQQDEIRYLSDDHRQYLLHLVHFHWSNCKAPRGRTRDNMKAQHKIDDAWYDRLVDWYFNEMLERWETNQMSDDRANTLNTYFKTRVGLQMSNGEKSPLHPVNVAAREAQARKEKERQQQAQRGTPQPATRKAPQAWLDNQSQSNPYNFKPQ